MAMLSFARGNAVDLDIYIYDQEGGTLTDPDGYAGCLLYTSRAHET